MVKNNELAVKTVVKDGKTYKNIDFNELGNGDTVTVTKKHDAVKRSPRKGTKFNPEQEWTLCQTQVDYKGQDVGFFFPRSWVNDGDNTKYMDNVDYADQFDVLGPAGTIVTVSVTNGFGKNKKGRDIVTKNYTFKKAE